MFEYPLSIVHGGLEMGQTMRTYLALRDLGVPVELLDYNSLDDDFDILHIFGNPTMIADLCLHACASKKVVISAVISARRVSYPVKHVRRFVNWLATLTRDHTGFGQRRSAFQSAAHLICLNELERRYVTEIFDVPPERVSVIVGGVWPEYFSPNGDLFRERFGYDGFVLHVGSIVRRKNPLQLALAIRNLGYRGVFIGRVLDVDYEYAQEFEKVVASCERLLWLRDLPYGDPLSPSAFGAAAAFCLPSSSETQPGAALEAMAAGLPVILGDYYYAYQRPFENVVRCNPNNLRSLERCLQKVMEQPAAYRQKLSEVYTWTHAAREIAQIYLKLGG